MFQQRLVSKHYRLRDSKLNANKTKENIFYISITLSAYLCLNSYDGLRDSRLSLVRPSGGLRLVAETTKKLNHG